MATALQTYQIEANDSAEVMRPIVSAIVARAQAVEITDAESYCSAANLLLQIKDGRKSVDKKFEKTVKAAHEAHKSVLALKNEVAAPLDKAEAILKPKLIAWKKKEEEAQKAEEARLQAEAKKRADDETLAAAAQAEKEGDKATAEAILNAPVEVAPVVLLQSTPKVDGISFKKVWKFRVVNEAIVPDEYWMLNLDAIGDVVTALKDKTNIPGIEVYPEDNMAAGRR